MTDTSSIYAEADEAFSRCKTLADLTDTKRRIDQKPFLSGYDIWERQSEFAALLRVHTRRVAGAGGG